MDTDLSSIESEKLPDKTKEEPVETTEIMSDSDDSDFIEVEQKTSPPKKSGLQVIVDTTNKLEDDLFKDIFEETPIKLEEIIKLKSDPNEKTVNEKPKNVEKVNQNQEKEVVIRREEEKPIKKIEDKLDEVRSEKSSKKVSFGMEDKIAKSQKVVAKKPKISVKELNKMKEDLRKEQQELMVEKNTKDRMGSDITTQMYQEAQVSVTGIKLSSGTSSLPSVLLRDIFTVFNRIANRHNFL